MNEQQIDVFQEQTEQAIDIRGGSSEQQVNVGSEPSVLHGIDGVSPIATVEQTATGATITITDKNGTTTADIENGKDGKDGKDGQDGRDGVDGQNGRDGQDGVSATIQVGTTTTGNAGTNASVQNVGTSTNAIFNFTIPRGATGATGATGKDGSDGKDGKDGTNGQDGFSPTATVSKSGSTATITITDKNGTTTASVSDGSNGQNGRDGTDGQDGQDGQDGYSPTATVVKTGDTATITITDKNGTTTASVSDGANGTNGTNGQDGYSPTASVVKSGDTATITITDKNGTTTASVKDGSDATQVNSDWNAVSGVAQILNKPTKLSQFTNDSGFITSYTETDPIFSASASAGITSSDITSWNNKSNFSGDYNDLTNKPTIPTVNNATLTIQKNGTDVQTFTANASTNATANIVVPTKTSDLTNDGADNTSTYLEADETAWKTKAIPTGQVDATSTATAFTATINGITELRDGVCMLLKNGVITSASGFTININGLGAKPVYNNMASASAETTIFNINYTMLFVYDSTRVEGGCWVCYRGYNSDTNTIAYQIRTNSTSLNTTDRTRYYRILFTSADGTQWVPANTQYDNSATSAKTVNQRKINPFGRIVYMTGTTSVNAGSAVSATVVWDRYALSLGYSFNRTGSALTLTTKKPVYVKCAPQSDGSAIMDSTTPIVQDLPTTEDGKIYIYLGMAYSATNIEMTSSHPVYYYKNGSIRLWTDAPTITVDSTLDADSTNPVQNKVINSALGAKANSADLASVATSGSYNDLLNKPTIPSAQVNSDWNANSGVAKILNKPTIPSNTSQLTNDSGFITGYTETDPIFSASASAGITSADITNWNNKSNFSGSYNDLSNKPTIPTAGTITSGSTGYATGGDVYSAIGNVESILQTLNNGGGAQ